MPNFITQRVGGVEIQTYLLAKHLVEIGWRVHFIAESATNAGFEEVCEGIQVRWIRQRGMFSFWRRDIPAAIHAIHPQVVYQRGRSRFTSSPWLYRLCNRPLVLFQMAENSDLNLRFSRETVEKSGKDIFRKSVLWIHAWLSDHYFRKTICSADAILVQHDRQQSDVMTKMGRRSFVIPSGHDVPDGPFAKDNPPVVLFMAHAGRRKQVELFVDLARSLKHMNTQFVMAGTIPDSQYRREVLESSRGLTNFHAVGHQDWRQSNEWFARASVFVNTTQPDREGFPNTYIQEWMRETPVVTLHCDPDGVIEKYRMGCHSRTFEQLVADVQLLIENHGLRSELGLNARAYALKHHDIRTTSRMVHEILTTLVAGSEESA